MALLISQMTHHFLRFKKTVETDPQNNHHFVSLILLISLSGLKEGKHGKWGENTHM